MCNFVLTNTNMSIMCNFVPNENILINDRDPTWINDGKIKKLI